MIEILGVNSGQEYEAAVHLRKQMLKLWPDLAQSKDDIVKIFVGFKMYGYKFQDLDIIVVGSFATPRSFDAEMKFCPSEGEPFVPKGASIRNFALLIEEKSHDASGVRFEGRTATVKYSNKKDGECVTEKAFKQMFEFKKYLRDRGGGSIYVQELVMFSGLKEAQLPPRPHNFIASDTSFERLLNTLGQISNPVRSGNFANLNFGSTDIFRTILDPSFELFDVLEPTPLDRKRMDLIAKQALPDNWVEDMGEKQILLKGRGGVGKTVILLQMAYRAYQFDEKRSLVLTFNKALVADLRRSMALLGVPRAVETGGIGIETAHGFFGRLMMALGIIDGYDDFLERYAEHKEVLLAYLDSGAVSRDDIDKLIRDQADQFGWDSVLVDEGQDWPSDEIAILRKIYGSESLVISDGVDQFVRGTLADWSTGVGKALVRKRRLTRCMRMKANLAAFVSDMATNLGIDDWDLEPNTDAAGGRIIIIEGDLSSHPARLKEWCDEAKVLKNAPVDLLACVPPSLAGATHGGGLCKPAAEFVALGYRVWDGTSRDVREHFATSRDQLRFVQYDSCRGLEGWTVINYGLDELWDYKRAQWLNEGHPVDDLYASADDLAKLHASRWVMIPLTRAIDTLVINIGSQQSFVRDALLKAAKARPDIVELIGFEDVAAI